MVKKERIFTVKSKLRLGIIGAGRRVHDMYAPIFKFNSNIEISGFWNRDIAKGQKLTDAFGYQRFNDIDNLSKNSDALMIVVNSSALTEVTMHCLDYGLPLMAETPVWSKDLVTKSNAKNIPLQIAEQTPWLPSEQFKMLLLQNTSTFGKPHTVVNDFRTFEYHGLAQLRRYIGYDKIPVDVCGMSHSFPMFPFKDGNGVDQIGHIENWDSGQIKFASGELAIYNFSSLYNRCKYRNPCSLRIYTDRASIENYDNDFTILHGVKDENGISHVKTEVTQIASLSSKTKSITSDYATWVASTDYLTDQQEALKVLVDNFVDHVVTDGKQKLLYDVSQGWTDLNLLMAIRHSAANKIYIRR